jgi:hypothetical protein
MKHKLNHIKLKQVEYVAKYHKTDKGRFTKLKSSAKSRKIEFALTLDQYCLILGNDPDDWKCTYCKNWIDLPNECGSLLDRKNSSLGYLVDNVCLCCKHCNTIKSDFFSYEEFLLIGDLILSKRLKHNAFKGGYKKTLKYLSKEIV